MIRLFEKNMTVPQKIIVTIGILLFSMFGILSLNEYSNQNNLYESCLLRQEQFPNSVAVCTPASASHALVIWSGSGAILLLIGAPLYTLWEANEKKRSR